MWVKEDKWLRIEHTNRNSNSVDPSNYIDYSLIIIVIQWTIAMNSKRRWFQYLWIGQYAPVEKRITFCLSDWVGCGSFDSIIVERFLLLLLLFRNSPPPSMEGVVVDVFGVCVALLRSGFFFLILVLLLSWTFFPSFKGFGWRRK